MDELCLCARACVCLRRLNGTANRKQGTPGPSAPCHGSHVTLWQHSIIDSHYHIRFWALHVEMPLFKCVCRCVCVCIVLLWTANNWFASTSASVFARLQRAIASPWRPACWVNGSHRASIDYLGYPAQAIGKSFRRHSRMYFKHWWLSSCQKLIEYIESLLLKILLGFFLYQKYLQEAVNGRNHLTLPYIVTLFGMQGFCAHWQSQLVSHWALFHPIMTGKVEKSFHAFQATC